MDEELPPFLKALIGDPPRAAVLVREQLADARARGDSEHIHAFLEMLLPTLIDTGDLDGAEACARELLTILEDSTHVMGLAQVFKARGDEAKAAELIERARALPEKHLDAEQRALMEQAGLEVIGRPDGPTRSG